MLIIEADPGVRMYTQVIFRDAGHRVTCVGDADQGLTMLASNRFDLAVVGAVDSADGEATSDRGLDLVKASDQLSLAARTRVVLHTADPLAPAEIGLLELEIEIVPRPAHPAELLALTNLGSGLELV